MDEQKTESVSSAPQQSAKEDLQKVADRAKVATGGFSFNKLFVGRLDEKNYFYGAIGSFVLGYILEMIPVIGLIVAILLLVLGFGLTIRRLHDINVTGWASIVLIIPFVGILFVIYLCWKKGDVATNTYGAVPEKNRDFFRALLNT